MLRSPEKHSLARRNMKIFVLPLNAFENAFENLCCHEKVCICSQNVCEKLYFSIFASLWRKANVLLEKVSRGNAKHIGILFFPSNFFLIYHQVKCFLNSLFHAFSSVSSARRNKSALKNKVPLNHFHFSSVSFLLLLTDITYIPSSPLQ